MLREAISQASMANQHATFVLADRKHMNQFKIGVGLAPGTVAREEARRRHGAARSSARMVQVHTAWKFRSYHAALYVEQAAIEMIRRFDYPEIDESGWFEIDVDGMAFIIAVIGPVADAIHQAESHLRLLSPALNPDKPYGRYRLQQTLRRFSTNVQADRLTTPSIDPAELFALPSDDAGPPRSPHRRRPRAKAQLALRRASTAG